MDCLVQYLRQEERYFNFAAFLTGLILCLTIKLHFPNLNSLPQLIC